MTDIETVDVDLEPSPRRRGGRERIFVVVGLGFFIAIGAAAVLAMRDNPPREGASEEGPAPDETSPDPEADAESPDGPAVAEIEPAGRYDGLDSIRLPLELEPDTDLVDGDVVRARGAGFTPRASVAIIQCAGADGAGSVENCDLSNYILGSADDQGYVDMTITVRRYISTGDGEIDCAVDDDVNCAVAIGNISNYDESGVATVWFDGNVDGKRSPVITVEPTTGLRDGDPLVVTGANFAPGDTVQLSQCVIGGSWSFSGCFSSGFVTDTVTADGDGSFTATVSATRHLASGSDFDCVDDVYGCRLAAHGVSDAPNPVRLHYDASVRSPRGVSFTFAPGYDLLDQTTLTVGLAQVPADGTVELVQCVDQGAIGVTCGEVVTAEVVGWRGRVLLRRAARVGERSRRGRRLRGAGSGLRAAPDGCSRTHRPAPVRARPMTSRSVQRLFLLGGLALLVGLGAVLVISSDSSSDPETSADEEDAAPDTEPDSLDPAGPYDGLESLQLPIEVVPDTGLVDLDTVIVKGSGFSPGATIAMVQCWLTDTGGSRDDCDLGNIEVAFADDQGVFEQPMTVRRVIGTINGERDCATGSGEAGCRIGVGNTLDLDESGGAPLFFDPQIGADSPPVITVSPNQGLVDGDEIVVAGSGFGAEEWVVVTQCPVGGMNDASSGCLSRNPGLEVQADTDGAFGVTIPASRLREGADGEYDCAIDIYHCMVVVRAQRDPNPIPLGFDAGIAPPLPPEFTLAPSRDLVDGMEVRLGVFDAPGDGASTVLQCADAGPGGIICEPVGVIEVTGGSGDLDLAVVRELGNGETTVDCAVPARICYLELADPEIAELRVPLYFAPVGGPE